jgi:hypothetical protein
LALGILDPNGPALDSQNAIRCIAELKNVAGMKVIQGKISVRSLRRTALLMCEA